MREKRHRQAFKIEVGWRSAVGRHDLKPIGDKLAHHGGPDHSADTRDKHCTRIHSTLRRRRPATTEPSCSMRAMTSADSCTLYTTNGAEESHFGRSSAGPTTCANPSRVVRRGTFSPRADHRHSRGYRAASGRALSLEESRCSAGQPRDANTLDGLTARPGWNGLVLQFTPYFLNSSAMFGWIPLAVDMSAMPAGPSPFRVRARPRP